MSVIKYKKISHYNVKFSTYCFDRRLQKFSKIHVIIINMMNIILSFVIKVQTNFRLTCFKLQNSFVHFQFGSSGFFKYLFCVEEIFFFLDTSGDEIRI